jgi:hypothetical protein
LRGQPIEYIFLNIIHQNHDISVAFRSGKAVSYPMVFCYLFIYFYSFYKWDVLFLRTNNDDVDRYWSSLYAGEKFTAFSYLQVVCFHKWAESDHNGHWTCDDVSVLGVASLLCMPVFSPINWEDFTVASESGIWCKYGVLSFSIPCLTGEIVSLFLLSIFLLCSDGERTTPCLMRKFRIRKCEITCFLCSVRFLIAAYSWIKYLI